jgi:hypothetical protein
VLGKEVRKQAVRKTTGIMESEFSYWIELQVQKKATFDAAGMLNEEEVGSDPQEILISESLYNKLEKGENVTGVILPVAENSFSFLVESDGSIVK